ncbi:MAG: Inner membrane protein [Candidatus Jettenia ecosi]|uniref:Inner membrane protein n=1 Tax=Candidatus Jettenia ecosi TaxID=2494326 RepID=A0A533QF30_9BACT|nr:MAG: Inner membrane protein [Candidatus Jettenia ecosi]
MFGSKQKRRDSLRAAPLPLTWLKVIERNVPFYRYLPEADQCELHRHIQVFLAERHFEGCGGLQITDEIKVTISAQACLLLLHRDTDYYPTLKSILVYPSAYIARQSTSVGTGMILESTTIRLGESWQRGAVILSWDDVLQGAADIHDGHNVVLHEFAHQLDQEGGEAKGSPILERRSMYVAWARILGAEYVQLQKDVQDGHKSTLDDYGATNPAEFFAVATECFFEKALQLKKKHPELYEELKLYYRQDPAQFRNR